MTETTGCPLCGKHCAPVRHPYGLVVGAGGRARPMPKPEDPTDWSPTRSGD